MRLGDVARIVWVRTAPAMAEVERPAIHCLAARMDRRGHFTCAPILVTLAWAASLKEEGWTIVGPDPQDIEALARWERERAG